MELPVDFASLGLAEPVMNAVKTAGYTTPTPIQAQAIPHVLARKDVLGIAQTGTGKTAAFTLPMLTLLDKGRARARMPRTLILEPTRELAAQVEEQFVKYGANQKLSVALLIGGVSFDDQDAKLTRGVDVLIATPGRLLDHFERGRLLLTGVELLVIDEADRMLDMGFIPDIERICKLVPFTRQTLFFTATMPPEIQRVTDQFLHNPVVIQVARASSTAATIQQKMVRTRSKDYEKRAALRQLIQDETELKNAIIFCNRKSEVATLHRSLERHGFSVASIHGDLDQRTRMANLAAFRDGTIKFLVASDVAARGLDIPDVSHVFNYDLPHHAEDYVHRIGRTGRAGKSGTAISIATSSDDKSLLAIEKLIGQPIPEDKEFVAPDLGEERPARPARGGRDGKRERGGSSSSRSRSSHPVADEIDTGHAARRARPAKPTPEVQAEAPKAPRPPKPEHAARQDSSHKPKQHQRGRFVDDGDDDPSLSVLPAFITRPIKRVVKS